MNCADAVADVMSCPFCGHVGVSIYEGSTFRWRFASCDGCGAQTGEVRVQTMGDGTKEQWEEKARADCLEEWNRRTP